MPAERAERAPLRDLVVGIGARPGVPAEELTALVGAVLAEAGLPLAAVRALATVDARAREPGLRAAAALLGLELLSYPAAALASVPVPHPSDAVLAAAGTPSVAEAAALAAAGPGGTLAVPKRITAPPDGGAARATCAVARRAAPHDSSTQPTVRTHEEKP
ncbi:cobalamin biosynthesis protein [Streptomyces purpurogeneiscleroticus]|uniref:cobalamin biosynthesis protein n=1 Tax=Streptomyces purpurogeneiscleroticus TaxID=68259 RepID=UPI001CBE6D2C|nr:cobalamin biosynthesis protein [Streptomyces purpurogeneiscleroticus]